MSDKTEEVAWCVSYLTPSLPDEGKSLKVWHLREIWTSCLFFRKISTLDSELIYVSNIAFYGGFGS